MLANELVKITKNECNNLVQSHVVMLSTFSYNSFLHEHTFLCCGECNVNIYIYEAI